MKLLEYFDRRCFKYLRCTPTPPGCYSPCPSAWVIAVAVPEQEHKPNLCYWVDTSLYWGDGLSRLYLKRFYPRATLVDQALRPLRKLGKIDSGHKVRYWLQHKREREKWIAKSSPYQIPTCDRTFGYDVLLRSEYKLHKFEHFSNLRYLRSAIVSPKAPNAIGSTFFFDNRQVVAWIEVDPVLQGLHCPEHWNRAFFVDHSVKPHTGYVDGLHSPPDRVGVVNKWSIAPGFETQPFIGEPFETEVYTDGNPLSFSSSDISRHKVVREKHLRAVGVIE
jgi:hypothetical protein